MPDFAFENKSMYVCMYVCIDMCMHYVLCIYKYFGRVDVLKIESS